MNIDFRQTNIKSRFLVSLIGNLIRSSISFVTIILLARWLGPQEFGRMAFLLATFLAFQQLFDMASSSALARSSRALPSSRIPRHRTTAPPVTGPSCPHKATAVPMPPLPEHTATTAEHTAHSLPAPLSVCSVREANDAFVGQLPQRGRRCLDRVGLCSAVGQEPLQPQRQEGIAVDV